MGQLAIKLSYLFMFRIHYTILFIIFALSGSILEYHNFYFPDTLSSPLELLYVQ